MDSLINSFIRTIISKTAATVYYTVLVLVRTRGSAGEQKSSGPVVILASRLCDLYAYSHHIDYSSVIIIAYFPLHPLQQKQQHFQGY